MPIAGNPDYIVAGRLLIRWNLLDRLWRLLIDHKAVVDIHGHGLGIGLVQRTTRQSICVSAIVPLLGRVPANRENRGKRQGKEN